MWRSLQSDRPANNKDITEWMGPLSAQRLAQNTQKYDELSTWSDYGRGLFLKTKRNYLIEYKNIVQEAMIDVMKHVFTPTKAGI